MATSKLLLSNKVAMQEPLNKSTFFVQIGRSLKKVHWHEQLSEDSSDEIPFFCVCIYISPGDDT